MRQNEKKKKIENGKIIKAQIKLKSQEWIFFFSLWNCEIKKKKKENDNFLWLPSKTIKVDELFFYLNNYHPV